MIGAAGGIALLPAVFRLLLLGVILRAVPAFVESVFPVRVKLGVR
jgi:hypothetical protein